MKKLVLLLVFLISVGTSLTLNAQKIKTVVPKPGHKLVFKIDDAKDQVVYLAIHYREKLLLRDSAKNDGRGVFMFAGENLYEEGLYTLVSQSKLPYLNFIIDGEQHFKYFLDTIGDVRNFRVEGSPQNAEMLRFQRKTVKAQQQVKYFQEKMKEFENGNKDSLEFYTQQMKNLNKEMEDFIKDLIAQNPNYLFSKLQKSYQYIDVPEPPVKADGTIDSNFQAIYYRTHFWDNFDLSDRRFLYLPSFERNMKEYFTKILWMYEPDTINTYIDMVLKKVESDSVMYRYFIEWLSYQFETSKIIGHDAVFVHIAKENQLKGKCNWLDEETIGKYQRRVSSMEPLLIGKKSVELIMPDTTQTTDFTKWHSSYRLSKPYVVLWFYDPTCHTCKSESEHLRTVYDSLESIGKRNFDVFAVGSDTDIERWKNYVKEKKYPWINVGGNSANIDYIEVYNIIGNPTMYIIDNSNKEIILNRRIEMNAIPTFLEQYEKIKESKKLLQQPK
ncbi:MAG: hypothetical protein CVU04_02270 [Bacteroidetes bacterium HGW-Bacteroidetes-20]|nr:MAG: hypothetical protein CVU04_02270 [Bacteroidetes bacterium HGW-Bacteroidetes-20]